MTMDEVAEEIRAMKWDLRILGDRAIRIADTLPADDRERIAVIADRITEATRDLLAVMARDELESEAQSVANLRDGMAELQRQLRLIARELDEVAGGELSH